MKSTILFLLIFISVGLKAQFNLSELNYMGFGTYAFTAFHVLPDGSYIGSFDFHSRHPFCDSTARGGAMAIVRFKSDVACLKKGANPRKDDSEASWLESASSS